MRSAELTMPTETSSLQGLAFSLWLPAQPRGGVVVIHGADSSKENHHDYARALSAHDLAAVCFDQRGHGASPGPLDDRVIDDVAMFSSYLRGRIQGRPIGLRGSSLGGYLALAAAEQSRAAAVVAICPAPSDQLQRGIRAGKFSFPADTDALSETLAAHPLEAALDALTCPVLLMHARGDEAVPVESSRALATRLAHPRSRLLELPGGHHRSIQHDAELQAVSAKFLQKALAI